MNQKKKNTQRPLLAVTERHDVEIEDLKQGQQKYNDLISQQLCKHKPYKRDYDKLKKQQEEEMNGLQTWTIWMKKSIP